MSPGSWSSACFKRREEFQEVAIEVIDCLRPIVTKPGEICGIDLLRNRRVLDGRWYPRMTKIRVEEMTDGKGARGVESTPSQTH